MNLDDSEYQRSDGDSFPVGHSSIDGPEVELFNRQTAEMINRALSEIPEKFKRIVVLSDIECFSYKEISEIEECPLGTVMSRLYRARRMLQILLTKYDRARES